MAESYQRKHCCGEEGKSTLCHFQPRCVLVALTLPRELRYDSTVMSERRRDVVEDTCYHASSLTKQSVASSRALNLRNSRWEKVFSAS